MNSIQLQKHVYILEVRVAKFVDRGKYGNFPLCILKSCMCARYE